MLVQRRKTMKCKICGTELPVVCKDCRSIDEDKHAVRNLIEQIRITTLYLDMLQMEYRKYTGRNYEFFK